MEERIAEADADLPIGMRIRDNGLIRIPQHDSGESELSEVSEDDNDKRMRTTKAHTEGTVRNEAAKSEDDKGSRIKDEGKIFITKRVKADRKNNRDNAHNMTPKKSTALIPKPARWGKARTWPQIPGMDEKVVPQLKVRVQRCSR